MSTRRIEGSAVENAVTDLWAFLNPVEAYVSGWSTELHELFVPTPGSLQQAQAEIARLRPALSGLPAGDLRETARSHLTLFEVALQFPQPGTAVRRCGDAAFYVTLKDESASPFVGDLLRSIAHAVAAEVDQLRASELGIEATKQCLNSARYCLETLRILEVRNPTLREDISAVAKLLGQFDASLQAPGGLGSTDASEILAALRAAPHAPRHTPGYEQMLSSLYDFTECPAELDLAASRWLEDELPLTKDVARELARQLALPGDSTIGAVWAAVSDRYAITADYMTTVTDTAKVCNDFAAEHLLSLPGTDHIVAQQTPAYLQPLMTGGQEMGIDYLTDAPRALLYVTPQSRQSFLTMLNILVHEYSHAFNMLLSSLRQPSPLLLLGGPMQSPLTEAQAFWREWEYWIAAARLVGKEGLTEAQTAYLTLYGAAPLEQSQTVRAAQLETHIWRVTRYIRVLCDVRVNMGWSTFIDFIDWAAGFSGLSAEFLYGECFPFLSRPGSAPTYAVNGITYGEIQRAKLRAGVSQKDYNTQASEMGFYPWTIGARRLREM